MERVNKGQTNEILEQIGGLQRALAELRAKLSEKWVDDELPTGNFDVFVCRAGESRFAVPVGSVKEVLQMCLLSEYPQGPPWLSGLLNLRGEVIPVLDVRGRIHGQSRRVRARDFIVVVSLSGKQFGLVFEEALHIRKTNVEQLQPALQEVPEALYVFGIIKVEQTPVFLLNLACLLGTSDIPTELL